MAVRAPTAPLLLGVAYMCLLEPRARAVGFLFPWTRALTGRPGGGARAADQSPVPLPGPQDGPDAWPLPVEAILSPVELIQHWRYPAEEHLVHTDDGYVLALQRIPWGREPSGKRAQRPPVFLQHGILEAADQWVLRGPDKDLAFILADLGYDVWLGNSRGNTHSRRHVVLSPESEQFWNFSIHENGYSDLAACIDYVLDASGEPSLFYVGHSMGTTALLVLLSTRPEYNGRVRAASLLAPVVYFTQPRGVLAFALPLISQFERELRNVHHEMLPRLPLSRTLASGICHQNSPTQNVCLNSYFQVAGINYREMNRTLFPVILSHIPCGASLGQFIHYVQIFKSGKFRQFDHGTRKNVGLYGQPTPPLYNLKNIVAPLMFHYSSGDFLSRTQDVERLAAEIPGTVGLYKVPMKEFNHGDYLWADDSYDLLYKTVVKLLRQF